jgi:hypothetical protein
MCKGSSLVSVPPMHMQLTNTRIHCCASFLHMQSPNNKSYYKTSSIKEPAGKRLGVERTIYGMNHSRIHASSRHPPRPFRGHQSPRRRKCTPPCPCPLGASFFRGEFIDCQLRETNHACLLGGRKRTNLRVLWQMNCLEQRRLLVKDLPLLAKSIWIVNDCFAITSQHLSHREISSHEANTVSKMNAFALFNPNGNKVPVGLDFDALVTIII